MFRWLRRTLVALLVLVAVVCAAFGAAWVATPSVGDAPQRVRTIAATHHAALLISPVPRRFADALTATEDQHFSTNFGIDPSGVARTALGTVFPGFTGGATIEQQLAKMLYGPGSGGLLAKAEQAMLAVKLSTSYPKPQILRMYADTAYFGDGHHGLRDAACGYFGVPPAQLDWGQAALLAGLVQAPSAYDPVHHPDLARERWQHVLDRLVAVGDLSQSQAKRIYDTPWGLVASTGTGPTQC